MPNEFPTDRFASTEEMLRFFKEKSDDIDGIQIMVANHMPIEGPSGEKKLMKHSCSMIKLCNGESIVIHREDLELLLNDGILSRMKIPMSLLPLFAE